MSESNILWATGRRKTSIAQVRMIPKGEGKVVVNTKPISEYFRGHERQMSKAVLPISLAEQVKDYDVRVKVTGGGITGQAEAIRHGLARAIAKLDGQLQKIMRKEGYLTRDPRMVERKKPGQPKARKKYQYSKR